MSTHLKEKIEKIEEIVAKLTEESAKGNLVVVEGKKDAQALRELGVTGAIVTVKTGGKSFLDATMEIEAFGSMKVIFLLDFDRRGKEGTKLLKMRLERGKIKVNTKLWHELDGLIGREVQCIESVPTYIRNLKEKAKL